jgi:hypothetical protein
VEVYSTQVGVKFERLMMPVEQTRDAIRMWSRASREVRDDF